MSTTHDEFLAANAAHQEAFSGRGLAAPPARHVAVLTCMDARIDIYRALGLQIGEAHVIRNAGGVLTDDAIRSLTLSQRKLGTTEIAVIQHTNCGLENLDNEAVLDELETATGSRPPWPIGGFSDVRDSVRASVTALRSDPHLIHVDAVNGYVYHVETGRLEPVES